MGPVVTDGSTVTVILSSPYAGITRSGSYGRRPRAVLSAHSACAPASLVVPHARVPQPVTRHDKRGRMDKVQQPTAATEAGTNYLSVSSFRFWFDGERWEWSDEVARMHGYEPGTVAPTTKLLLSHKHPDDRAHVQDLIQYALHSEESFSSRHRFIDTAGKVHDAIA